MKIVVFILLSILLIVFIALEKISEDNTYTPEKLFYEAVKINRQIAKNPKSALPKMYLDVERNLQKIVTEYPESALAKEAHLMLAQFYLNNKKYVQALAASFDIINKYS